MAIALLDDEHGICDNGFCELNKVLQSIEANDIINAIEAVNERFFLPENHGLIA